MLLSLLSLHGCATFLLAAASVVPSPRPLVLWHGLGLKSHSLSASAVADLCLGDSHSSPGMLEFMSLIKDVHPNIFIHSIFIDQDLNEDRKAGFYGNVDNQLEIVAEQLASIPELEFGFDGIGLSQGGQFLRAYVERYNRPPVNNLITFGSQHMGISNIPLCRPYDFLCQVSRRAALGAVYTSWAQNNLIQAQYYRDPSQYDTYLRANRFLTSINNEVEETRNKTYARNLASLNKLVLVIFTEDKTVMPKESSWFGSEEVLGDSGISGIDSSDQQRLGSGKTIVPMREQRLYVEDWIGLRKLDEDGRIVFEACDGEHMEMGGCWEDLVKKYTG